MTMEVVEVDSASVSPRAITVTMVSKVEAHQSIYIWFAVTPCVYLLCQVEFVLLASIYNRRVDCSGVRETSQKNC